MAVLGRIIGLAIIGTGAWVAHEPILWFVRKVEDKLRHLIADPGLFSRDAAFAVAGALVMVLGAWLLVRPDLIALHRQDKALAARMADLAARIGALDRTSPPDSSVIGETLSVYRSLQARRIATPAVDFSDAGRFYGLTRHIVTALEPLIRNGQLGDARDEAPRLIRGAGAEPQPPRRRWLPRRA